MPKLLGIELLDIEATFRLYALEDRLEQLELAVDSQLKKIQADRKDNVNIEDIRFLADSTKRLTVRKVQWLNGGARRDSAIDLSETLTISDTQL